MVATGRNFELSVDGKVGECRVWRRPDLSREEGAKCGDEMCEALASVAKKGVATALLFDLRQAPPAGPLTQRAISRLLETIEGLGVRVAILVGSDPLHKMQMTRMVAERAPKHGRVFDDDPQARAWVRQV